MSLHLLKARTAQYRPSLRRAERYGGVFTASRALGARLGAHPRTAIGALRLALLAALGIVLELFVVKKQLLASGEDELFPAINTLQDSICEFHGRLPRTQATFRFGHDCAAAVPFPVSFVFPNTGPGR